MPQGHTFLTNAATSSAVGRFSGGTRRLGVGHIASEAWVGGPIALVREGDSITIVADQQTLTLNVSKAELNKRRQGWVKPEIRVKRGVLAKYARTVGSASQGVVAG